MTNEPRRVKRTIVQDQTKEQIIEEAMQANEEYFRAVEAEQGEMAADTVRRRYREELEEDLKDYKQGEEIELEMIQVDCDCDH